MKINTYMLCVLYAVELLIFSRLLMIGLFVNHMQCI